MSAAAPIPTPYEQLSDLNFPTDADVLLLATYLRDLAEGCDLRRVCDHTDTGGPATIGRLRTATKVLVDSLTARMQRDAQLRERFDFEARQDAAHEALMETDDDYAAEFDGGGEDE